MIGHVNGKEKTLVEAGGMSEMWKEEGKDRKMCSKEMTYTLAMIDTLHS